MNHIVGCTLFAALSPIATKDLDASIFQLRLISFRQVCDAELCQFLDVLDTNHMSSTILIFNKLIKSGAQIATPAANIQNSCPRA